MVKARARHNMISKMYIRDGRAPIPKKEVTSRVMSSIRAKNTKPERALRKALCDSGLKGYRLHWDRAPGRPDICYPGKKMAIFVHGCYWHRCPHCKPSMPKSHALFWRNKFKLNKERDRRKEMDLINSGWRVITFWECQLEKNAGSCVRRVYNALGEL